MQLVCVQSISYAARTVAVSSAFTSFGFAVSGLDHSKCHSLSNLTGSGS